MTPAEVIRAAIPDADEALVEHILWGRTPFPCGPVSALDIYRAASRFARAKRNGLELCDCCDRLVIKNHLCASCRDGLEQASHAKKA